MPGFYASIAPYYDIENADKTDDLPFYADLADRTGDPILVAGAGTGRVLIHLADQGHTIHGIEREEAMIERAERKLDMMPERRDRVTLLHADLFEIDPPTHYPLILLPYNTFTHFHDQDMQLALLTRLRGWLTEGGVLVIDLPNAGDAYAGEDTGAVTFERTFLDPDSGRMIMQQSVTELDRADQLLFVTWIYDEIMDEGMVKRTVATVVNRYFFWSEMQLLLKLSGFEQIEARGDFAGEPFADGCPNMIVLAK